MALSKLQRLTLHPPSPSGLVYVLQKRTTGGRGEYILADELLVLRLVRMDKSHVVRAWYDRPQHKWWYYDKDGLMLAAKKRGVEL